MKHCVKVLIAAVLPLPWVASVSADEVCRLVQCTAGEDTVAVYDINTKAEVDRVALSQLKLPLAVEAEKEGYCRVKVGGKALWLESFDFATAGCEHKGGRALVDPGRPGQETLGTRGLSRSLEKR